MGTVNIVQVTEKHSYSKATTFILPMINEPLGSFKSLLNCFIADFTQSKNQYNFNRIFILTNVENSQLRSNVHYQEEYLINEKFMYVFRIPSYRLEDYKIFLSSKYSEFSEDYKALLIGKIVRKDIQNSTVYQVLHKSAVAKKQIEDRIGQLIPANAEVLSAIDFAVETYGYNEIEELESN